MAAVVGAGMSGLSAAYRLAQAGWDVQVFEAGDRPGGRVETLRRDGYVIDTAATAVGGSYLAYRELAAELGIPIVEATQCLGIERHGRVHLVRLDRLLSSGLTSKLISPAGKLRSLRLALDVARAKRRGWLDYADMRNAAPIDDESARDYALRALGPELDSYLCEPVTRAMLIADSHRVSKVELFSGIANVFSGAWGFIDGGADVTVQALAERVPVTLHAPVTRVRDTGAAVEVSTNGETRAFDAAVLACPLPVAAQICPDRHAVLDPLNAALDYTRAITVAVGTTRRPDCPAVMIQYASRDDPYTAMLFLDHNKSPRRTPPGHGLFTAEIEMQAAADLFDADDETIAGHAIATITRCFPEIDGTIDLVHVRRWPLGLVHTKQGAFAKIGAFNAALDPCDRVQFAADYMSQAGQNTGVSVGSRAAANLIAALR